MKIAYIVNINSSIPSGIISKINEHVKEWHSLGCEVVIFDLCSTSSKSLIDGCAIIKVGNPCGLFQRLKLQNGAIKKLEEMLKKIKPDLIYMRYMLSTRPLLKILGMYLFILEINTDDTHEFNTGFKLTHYYNKMTRAQLLKRASGFVVVTHELKTCKAFSLFKKPTLTLANGIDMSLFLNHIPSPKASRVLFIGTPGCSWHGIDKILQIAKYLPERHFDIIGFTQLELEQAYPVVKQMDNITGHGFLSLDQSKSIAANASVAISTLALHRKSMSEACSLKTRFYLALGLPVILGYNDTDLRAHDLDFILNIGNMENNVVYNINQIKAFILKSSVFSTEKIKSFSKKYLSCTVKESQRIKFFAEILNLTKNL